MRVAASPILATIWILLLAAVARAAPDPAARCASTKLRGTSQQSRSQAGCEARAITSNTAIDPACVARARGRTQAAFDHAEARGGCVTTGDAARTIAAVDAVVADLAAALPFAADQASRRCAAAKLRAAGAAAARRLLCHARAALAGEAADAGCLAQATGSLERAFARAEAPGSCATIGDAAAIGSAIGGAVAGIASSLGPVCGDGAASYPEECDDGNDAPGDGCSSSCELEDASALCAGVASASGTSLAAVLVTNQLSEPVGAAAPRLDPNRLFVVERAGRIRIVKNGLLLPGAFLDIRTIVGSAGTEQGLLGLAFHPGYEGNRRFFVNYTNLSGDTVIARYQASAGNPEVADPASARILLTIDQPFGNHNGGQLAFGPDGTLYVGMGDGGGGGDPNETAQDDGELLGKLLRIDVDVDVPPYHAVPPSNPNAGAGDPLGLVWAKGLRNPWRFGFDRATGDLLIADVGQGANEEVDFQPASSAGGENYGWDVFEGSSCFEPAPNPVCPSPTTGFSFPIHEYTHAEGCSITGGFVYRGCVLPGVHGTYFYGDYCSGFIRTFEVNGGSPANHLDRTAELDPPGSAAIGTITSFGEDARGELYVLDHGGELFKIVPGS